MCEFPGGRVRSEVEGVDDQVIAAMGVYDVQPMIVAPTSRTARVERRRPQPHGSERHGGNETRGGGIERRREGALSSLPGRRQ